MKYQINYKRLNVFHKIASFKTLDDTDNKSIEQTIKEIKNNEGVENSDFTSIYEIKEVNKGFKECPKCFGTGNTGDHVDGGRCWKCNGTGKIQNIEIKRTKLNLKKYMELV